MKACAMLGFLAVLGLCLAGMWTKSWWLVLAAVIVITPAFICALRVGETRSPYDEVRR